MSFAKRSILEPHPRVGKFKNDMVASSLVSQPTSIPFGSGLARKIR